MFRTLEARALCLTTLLALAGGARAQTQFAEIRKQHVPPWNEQAASVAIGDFDRDGDVDVIAVGPSGALFYANDGGGVFTDQTTARLPASSRFVFLAAGDVDRDGDLDLLLSGGMNPAVLDLWLNNGTGAFFSATALVPQVPVMPQAVLLADLDADGDLDAVIGNSGIGPTHLFLNNGLGRFSDVTAASMPVHNDHTLSIAAGDVDRDGDLDLVLGNIGQPDRLYVNSGRAVFTDVTAAQLPNVMDATQSVALGDVDRDGDLDLVSGNRQPNQLYLNDGRGFFTRDATGRLPADAEMTASVQLGDVDGDADLDLVAGKIGQSRFYRNDGRGTFTDATQGSIDPSMLGGGFWASLLDADGDGDLDVFWSGFASPCRLGINDGTGVFHDGGASALPPTLDHTRAAVAGDVDGDGDLDLFTGGDRAYLPEALRLYLNDGVGLLRDATAGRVPASVETVSVLALGDVDGDGDLDLVRGSGRNSQLFLNDGRGTFRDATAQLPLPVGVRALVLGDLDGDGDLDLLASLGSSVVVARNAGGGRFVSSATLTIGDSVNALALGDFDGDGDLDVYCAGGSITGHALLLNDGKALFTAGGSLPGERAMKTCTVAGDLDGDRDLDLIVGTHTAGPRLFLNDGGARFRDASTQLTLLPDVAQSLALGDLDADGDLDLVAGHGLLTALLLNDGAARFTDLTMQRTPSDLDGTAALVLADFDGDRDLDVLRGIVPGRGGHDRLLANRLRQIETPWLPRLGRTYRVDCAAAAGFAPSGQFVVPLLSAGRALPPLDVPPFGRLHLDLGTLVVLPPLAVPAPSGIVSPVLALPRSAALAGRLLHWQALVLHGSVPATWRLSNAISDRIVP